MHNIHEFADIIVAFDRVGSMNALPHVRNGGLLIYGDEMHTKVPHFDEQLRMKEISTIFIPEYATPRKLGANEFLSNMLMLGALWRALGLSVEGLLQVAGKKFASKPALLALDISLIRHGYLLNDAVIQNEKLKKKKEKLVPVIPEFWNASEAAWEMSGIQVDKLSQSESNKEWSDDLDSVLQWNDGTSVLVPFSLPVIPLSCHPAILPSYKLLDWNEILALSAVHHGVRAYFAYPMSPSSTILTHLANWAEKTGMHVEQVEDEISVSQMTLGANFAGTRSLCATSGGGFDLMTETVSLAGMIETPLVIIVAQRPGPATGLPTWSATEDLNLAIYSGHGEYAKAVIAVGDHAEAFTKLGEALNLAETFQMPVILLTDKTLAETNITINTQNLEGVEIERGLIFPSSSGKWIHCVAGMNEDPGIQVDKLREANNTRLGKTDLDSVLQRNDGEITLSSSSRYELTESGISPRWLPGTGPVYYANGDEHGPDGTLREDALGVAEAHEKRKRKMETLKNTIPEPELIGNPDAKITIVGWGSTLMEVRDFLPWIQNSKSKIQNNNAKNKTSDTLSSVLCPLSWVINYLHYSYLFPLKTETIKKLSKKNKIIVMEHNMTGQLATLLRSEWVRVDEQWNKYDGRRFYWEEVEAKISSLASSSKWTILRSMKSKYIAILVLALIALGNAAYLSYTAYQLLHPVAGITVTSGCDINPTFSCTNVIVHPDTMIAGIPFPYLALLVYPLIAALAIWGLMSITKKPAQIIKWIALWGICFNGYIISQEILYIHAYCLLCLICAAIIVIIFWVSWTMKK